MISVLHGDLLTVKRRGMTGCERSDNGALGISGKLLDFGLATQSRPLRESDAALTAALTAFITKKSGLPEMEATVSAFAAFGCKEVRFPICPHRQLSAMPKRTGRSRIF